MLLPLPVLAVVAGIDGPGRFWEPAPEGLADPLDGGVEPLLGRSSPGRSGPAATGPTGTPASRRVAGLRVVTGCRLGRPRPGRVRPGRVPAIRSRRARPRCRV